MKKLFLILAGMAVFLGAQDVTGTWQGALQLPNGRELRTVLKIAKADGGTLRGQFFSIDQGGQPMSINQISVQGTAFKMSIPAVAGTYEGKLDPDGGTITGNWSQGPGTLPLVLKRVTPETAWAIPEPPPPPKMMAADAKVEFEVATVKPSVPDRPGKAYLFRGRQFTTLNTTLVDLIAFAYNIHAKQIMGGPGWMESEKFDLAAQPNAEGQPNDKQLKAMVQELLAERFKLVFHRDKKELGVYAITIGKGGPKLNKSEGNPNGLPGLGFRALGNMFATNATIGDLAGVMQGNVLDRPVIDQTGITGRFDFTLLWTPDEFQFQFQGMGAKVPPPANNAAAPPDLFTAMQEQLGLKLESTKAPAEVFVIDGVAKPTDN